MSAIYPDVAGVLQYCIHQSSAAKNLWLKKENYKNIHPTPSPGTHPGPNFQLELIELTVLPTVEMEIYIGLFTG